MVSVKNNLPKKIKHDKMQKPLKVEKIKKSKPGIMALPPKDLVSDEVEPKPVIVKTSESVTIKKRRKYVMPSKYITEDRVDLCLAALEQLTAHYKKKNTIFEDDTSIFAEINCIKIQNTMGNIKFVLPHSSVASTGEVCLITPDLKKGRKVDHEPSVDHWEEKLRNAGVTSVKTVLPMRQLRVEYDQYELKRRLLTQHDFIMVDTRVLNHVSHLLGKMFFKKHNMLIPVRITKDLKKDMDIGLRTAMLRLNEGATSTIIVGHTGMEQKHVKENVLSLVKQIKERYPGGEANIRSISLKLPLSLSLPLYLTLRPSSTIGAPKLKQKKPKHFVVLEDELSTIPGSTVRVAPDGTVHIQKPETNSDMEADSDAADDNAEVEASEERIIIK